MLLRWVRWWEVEGGVSEESAPDMGDDWVEEMAAPDDDWEERGEELVLLK